MNGMSIARSGLEASMLRLTASASNIANAQSNGAVPGSGGQAAYQPVRAELSPSAGGARRIALGVAENFSGVPTTRCGPAVAWPTVTTISRAAI